MMIKQDIRPPVTISASDYDRLAFLASFGLNFQQDRSAAAMLADELIRATVLTPRAIPPSVATMHSRLEFRDDITWKSGVSRWFIPMRTMARQIWSPCCRRKARR